MDERSLIGARRKEAADRGILGKAADIAMNLVKGESMTHGTHYIFERMDAALDGRTVNSIRIWYDDYGTNCSIEFNGVKVFSTQLGEVTAYRPDIKWWEEWIDAIHAGEVMPKLKEKEGTEAEKRRAEISEKWGIPESSLLKHQKTIKDIMATCVAAQEHIRTEAIEDFNQCVDSLHELVDSLSLVESRA